MKAYKTYGCVSLERYHLKNGVYNGCFWTQNGFFSETKFLKYTLKLIYVNVWSNNNDVSFER